MSEPTWLALETVFKIHDRQIEEHGGLIGVRDENLLISAINRPQNLYHYGQPTIFEMAASLAFGLAKNHPFNDANKRTAYVSCRTFIRINGYDLLASDENKLDIMLKLSADQISQEDFTKWLELNCKKV